jgi:hypothetical protein
MDQIDEYEEDLDDSWLSDQSQSLTGESEKRGSEISIDRSDCSMDDAVGSYRADSNNEGSLDDSNGHLRCSNRSEMTPRQQNKRPEGRHTQASLSTTSMGQTVLPFRQERSARSLQSSHASLGSHFSKSHPVKFHQDASDDVSEPSLHLHALSGPGSPASISTGSLVKRTPSASRAFIRKIGMDGSVSSLPLTGNESESLASATIDSMGRPPNSPSKRTRESMNKSYFAGSQDLFADSLSDPSVTSKADPATNRSKDSMDADDSDDLFDPIICCSFECPLWCTSLFRGAPSLNRISRFVVNFLPCFLCCSRTAQGATSDRAVLTRLNILCLFMTTIQLVMALWLTFTLLILDDGPGLLRDFAPHFWNCNGATFSIGILAVVIMLTCSFTIRVIKEVDVVRAIRCLWIILWIIPFEIFFNISLYDYYNVTEVWIRHWWLEDNMSWFRNFFCEIGTSMSTCLVPIDGGAGFESEDAWCLANYNTDHCTQVRNDAQDWMQRLMLTFYTGLAGWSSVLLGFMLLMVNSLAHIITKPIVQKSRESNVPAWLFLPTVTNAMVGVVLRFSPSSLLNESSSAGHESSWIGIAYLCVASLFLVSLLTGWFLSSFTIRNHGDKQTKNVAVVAMIVMMATNVTLLAVIFVGSILHAAQLSNSPIDEGERGLVACQVDRGVSCTLCDEKNDATDQCPEWTLDEVTQILQTQLKQSAALAAIFILYAVSVLRFGITLRRHLSLYQIDYV